MLCSHVFTQCIDTPKLCLSGHRHAKPGIVQVCPDIQQIGPLGQKQELMLRILRDLPENLLLPFRFPSCQVAHSGKQIIVRTRLLHHAQFAREKLGIGKIIDHVIPLHVIPGIAVRTSYGTADDQVHILDKVFNANAHDFSLSSRFLWIRRRSSSNRAISSSVKPA